MYIQLFLFSSKFDYNWLFDAIKMGWNFIIDRWDWLVIGRARAFAPNGLTSARWKSPYLGKMASFFVHRELDSELSCESPARKGRSSLFTASCRAMPIVRAHASPTYISSSAHCLCSRGNTDGSAVHVKHTLTIKQMRRPTGQGHQSSRQDSGIVDMQLKE